MANKLTPIPDHLRKETIEWIDLDAKHLDGPIDVIIERLQKYKANGVESIKIEESYESTYFYLVKKRPETDKEYRARIKREEEDRIAEEKYKKEQEKEERKMKIHRRKLYLELKKEFES